MGMKKIARRFRKSLLGIGILCFVLWVLLMGYTFRSSLVRFALSCTAYDPRSGSADGGVTFLLLASGGRNHAGADLTDTIQLIHINRAATVLSTVAIPRDLSVSDAGGTPGRINEILARRLASVHRMSGNLRISPEVLEVVRSDFSILLGTPIDAVLHVDFQGFRSLIDAIGGIDVTVPNTIVDPLFPMQEGVVGTLRIPAGLHHFDGAKALQYARIRHMDTDFERSARQQQVIAAILSRVRSLSLREKYQLFRASTDLLPTFLTTTIVPSKLLGTALLVLMLPEDGFYRTGLRPHLLGRYGTDSVGGFLVAPDPSMQSGAYLLEPMRVPGAKSLWGPVRHFLNFTLHHSELLLRPPRIQILSEGSNQGQALLLKAELMRYGWLNVQVETGHLGPFLWYRGKEFHPVAQVIGQWLGLPILPQPESLDPQGDLQISLSPEYVFLPFSTAETLASLPSSTP